MKKNLFLRLFLMMTVLLSTYSCRQDILPEQETYHNTSAFQLTSKRISLNESKHKGKLLPELKKAEIGIENFLKNNAHSKVVNYGNGVTIDTDDVIYIENGSDYYTYTFKIKRENAPADAPVENLVLSPLSDGSWKEEFVTYNLTAQEKQTMLLGGAVNLVGKVTKEILQSGTYSSGIINKNSWDNCYLVTSSYYTTCSGNQHSHGEPAGELEDGNCPAEQVSVLVVTSTLVCSNPGGGYTGTGSNESGTTPGGFNPNGGSGSTNPTDPTGSNGSNNPENPCDGSGIPSQPQDPGSTLGNQPCNNGTITLPNLGGSPFNNPCQKTKAMLENPAVQIKLDSLKKKSTEGGEIGFKIKKDGTTSDIIDGGEHEVDLGSMTGWQGGYHNHTVTGIPMHSPPDIDNGLLKLARSQPTQPVGEHNNAYFGMIVKKACSTCTGGFKIYHYVIRFNGNYDDAITNFSQEKLDELKDTYRTREKQLSETLPYVDFLGAANLNNRGLEKLFFETLTNMNIPNNVVTLQRVDDDGNGNITVNNITLDANGIPQATPCP